MDASDWKVWTALSGGLTVLTGWFIKHISNRKQHTSVEGVVFSDVCNERGKTNEQAHVHLKEGIDAAIVRSDEQHKELKTDMRRGFTEIKTLIRGLG